MLNKLIELQIEFFETIDAEPECMFEFSMSEKYKTLDNNQKEFVLKFIELWNITIEL